MFEHRLRETWIALLLALVGFKSHVRAKAIPAEAVYVVSQRGLTALSGSAIELLAPLLDGTRTRAQLTSEVSAYLSAGEVQQVLDRLSGAGLIDFVQPSAAGPGDRGDERTRAYWDLAGIAPDVAASALAALGRAAEQSAVTVVVDHREHVSLLAGQARRDRDFS